ncbi:hypothetical protein [Bradyrhizobium sp. Arg816]|uniref:hypothetical protein n=1 Tax=Bradyrhizobium sp. Arg816 TaxID=2998491 RepID=UPI00249F4D44|nr:hypothetical protein [Bradyrhizobium sp. Arg816]MDI3565049.1 hypothetical protein [Bradyrhizobium sp. Arg816]
MSEQKAALYFLLALVVVALPFLLTPAAYPLSTKVAACGGTLAFIGVLAMSRNVLRVGPFEWITRAVFSHSEEFSEAVTKEERRAGIDDHVLANVIGPCLVGVGTMINGFSGYFS